MNQPLSKHLSYIKKIFGHQPNADELLTKAKDLFNSDSKQKVIHDFLELGHLSIINKKIYDSNKVEEWFDVIHKLIVILYISVHFYTFFIHFWIF